MTINDLFDWTIDALLRASWQGAVAVLLVACVCTLLPRMGAKWRSALWLLVLIRLLLPSVPPSPTSLFNLTSEFANPTSVGVDNLVLVSVDAVPTSLALASTSTDASQRLPTTSTSTATVLPSVERGIQLSYWLVIGGIWLLGVFAMAAYRAVLMLRLRKLLSECRVEQDGSAVAILNACKDQFGIRRRVSLLVTDRSISGALAGGVRPRIIVSAETLATLSSNELAWLFRHELSHVRRWDVAVQTCWWWARAIHWFNPLVWWAVSRARIEAELACDESVLEPADGSDRAGYGYALLRVAEVMAGARLLPGTIPFFTRRPALATRIGMIARYRRRSRGWTAAAIVCALALTCSALTDSMPAGSVIQPAQATAADANIAPESDAKSEDDKGPAETPRNDAKSAKRTMRIQVLGPDDKPLARTKVHASVWTPDPFDHNRDYSCDDEGRATVELPPTIEILRIWARKPTYVPMFMQWWPEMQPDGALIPDEYTVKLDKGTLIGGIVVNDEGEPIPDVRVEVALDDSGGLTVKRPVPDTWLAWSIAGKYTDAQGRWTLDNVPAGEDVRVRLKLSHRDYVNDYNWGGLQKEQEVTMQALRNKTAEIVMHRGYVLSGTITDPDGNPVPDAVVVWGQDPYHQEGRQEFRTDKRGIYHFPPLAKGPLTVTVIAEGWMPEQKERDIAANNPPLDFQLKPGKTVRIRFVDNSGPVSNVHVGIEDWRGGKALYNHRHPNVLDAKVPYQANEKGIFEWTWAPDDPVTYNWHAEGYNWSPDANFTLGPGEHVISLPSGREVKE